VQHTSKIKLNYITILFQVQNMQILDVRNVLPPRSECK